ncbi:MAG: hypothetical protein H7834_07940 [Magnetococcus sp. YQC-9]
MITFFPKPIHPGFCCPSWWSNQADLTGCNGRARQSTLKPLSLGFIFGPCSRDCFAKGAKQSRKPWRRAAFVRVVSGFWKRLSHFARSLAKKLRIPKQVRFNKNDTFQAGCGLPTKRNFQALKSALLTCQSEGGTLFINLHDGGENPLNPNRGTQTTASHGKNRLHEHRRIS